MNTLLGIEVELEDDKAGARQLARFLAGAWVSCGTAGAEQRLLEVEIPAL